MGRQRKGKEKVWGPVVAQRKSKRVLDDSRTMLEKTQDCKRNYNLEEQQGNRKFPQPVTNKANLVFTAAEIGLVGW